MDAFFEQFNSIYQYIIKFAVIIIELISAGIICFTIIKSLINLIRGKQDIRLEVSEGIALALEFKLGSEVLRTLIVRELTELAILGIIIVLMAALSIFVQWGIKNEHKNAALFKTLQEKSNGKADGDAASTAKSEAAVTNDSDDKKE